MNESRPAAQALMACLGEESRFRLVQALLGGARCVTDLAAAVGLSQSCTTRHLQALERRQLVTGKRDGKRVLYRIREDDPELLSLLGWALSEPRFQPRPLRRAAEPARGRGPNGPAIELGQSATAAPPLEPLATISWNEGQTPPDDENRAQLDTVLEPAGRASRPGGSDIEDYLL